ncbi:hypothetical protein [Dietzia maris]|uniref:hypothetical protein n=1 Tax=Dietzia maris TaxID=37915 RepID=UPI0037CCBDDC
MIVNIVGQEAISVTEEQGIKIVQSIVNGAEFVIIGANYIKTTAILSVVGADGREATHRSLAAGEFNPDRREARGEGFERFQALREELLRKRAL